MPSSAGLRRGPVFKVSPTTGRARHFLLLCNESWEAQAVSGFGRWAFRGNTKLRKSCNKVISVGNAVTPVIRQNKGDAGVLLPLSPVDPRGDTPKLQYSLSPPLRTRTFSLCYSVQPRELKWGLPLVWAAVPGMGSH